MKAAIHTIKSQDVKISEEKKQKGNSNKKISSQLYEEGEKQEFSTACNNIKQTNKQITLQINKY